MFINCYLSFEAISNNFLRTNYLSDIQWKYAKITLFVLSIFSVLAALISIYRCYQIKELKPEEFAVLPPFSPKTPPDTGKDIEKIDLSLPLQQELDDEKLLMKADAKPLALYQAFNDSEYYMNSILPPEIISIIKEHYIAQFPIYDECKTEIDNDLFPTKVYRQLKLMKDSGVADYKVGGSAALKIASADNTWENDDVDIMVYTEMNTFEYAAQLGLTHLTKSWTKGLDSMKAEREEKFHESIYQVLTFEHDGFDKKIQLVFFEKFYDSSFANFLDKILDYPAHVLYEVDFDRDDKKIYNFFLPIKMWGNILQKRIPRNLHCLQSTTRIQKYIERGFEFCNWSLGASKR